MYVKYKIKTLKVNIPPKNNLRKRTEKYISQELSDNIRSSNLLSLSTVLVASAGTLSSCLILSVLK
jgi:DNA-directed RNA polymerase subunit E'/Rpb7